jgi:hypothetical protein
MIPTSRKRCFRRTNTGLVDTGWELCEYGQHGEMWEPADTVFARGANGPTKVITGILYVDDTMGQPVRGDVFYPRTGTAAA